MKGWVSWKWLVVWSVWAARLVRQPSTELHLSCGTLRGSVAHDGSHRHYLGIPYATYKSEEHRFKASGPEPRWEGVFEAIEEYIRCPQRLFKGLIFGQENCLILNVYTPLNADPHSRLSVMVFIHGGGFFEGSSSRMLYGPEYLVTKDVILVTINYRLNIQGFLCLRTKDAPGNAGMKDQVAALKWIQRHIATFGGDPDNVTLFGESAGAVSVSMHVLSPMSAGLFHKAIQQSGSSLTPWAYQLRPVYMASLLTKAMQYETEDPSEIYKILMSKSDAELVLTRVPRKDGNTLLSELLYTPCTEAVIDGIEPFLTGVPHELLSRGEYNKVPMIIGTNSEEGFLFAVSENSSTMIKPDKSFERSTSRIEIEKSLPKDLVIHPEKKRKEVTDRLKKMYFGGSEISKENLLSLSRFVGEMYFNLPGITEIEMIASTSPKPVYGYLFAHDGWRNLVSLSLGGVAGATHADDLFYLFKSFRLSLPWLDNSMLDTITSLWTNFAKYGAPKAEGIQWAPVQSGAEEMLELTSIPRPRPLYYTQTLKYWKEIYRKYRRSDYG